MKLSFVVDAEQRCAGFILTRGPHRFEAFDKDEITLGSFAKIEDAVRAVFTNREKTND